MGDYILWLLAATGLCLLVGWQILRHRAAARQARAEHEAAAEAQRCVDLERQAAAAELETQRLAVEQADTLRRAQLRAEAERVEAQRIEAARIAEQRIEAERVEAERRAAELAERERLALAEAEHEARRLLAEQAEQAAREAQARAEAQRQAELCTEEVRLAAEHAAATVPARAVKSAAQTLVLVADDSKVVRIKTGRLLAQHQYQVAYASDGLDAVQQMQARLPDVLITDVEMPGMDGFELTRHIRCNPQTAQLPVIMITAADDRHREQADAAGVSVLLGKPYPEDALMEHIRRALGQDAAAPAPGAASTHGALDALA